MNGTLHQKNTSKAFQISQALLIEMLIPFILGMLAITAHARLRLHLGIPGHQGILRKTSKIKWSSFIFSVGVASMLYVPFLGFGDPFAIFVYLWPGIIFDLLYVPNKSSRLKIWFVAIIGGIAYSSIPLSRFLLGLITGIMHKSVALGLMLPVLSFFTFGLIGVLIGIGACSFRRKSSEK